MSTADRGTRSAQGEVHVIGRSCHAGEEPFELDVHATLRGRGPNHFLHQIAGTSLAPVTDLYGLTKGDSIGLVHADDSSSDARRVGARSTSGGRGWLLRLNWHTEEGKRANLAATSCAQRCPYRVEQCHHPEWFGNVAVETGGKKLLAVALHCHRRDCDYLRRSRLRVAAQLLQA